MCVIDPEIFTPVALLHVFFGIPAESIKVLSEQPKRT
jgi:hypothetical protein